MKKIILLLAFALSVVGLNAQTIGSYNIVNYKGYELQYTVTKLSPAECSVKCVNITSDDAIEVVSIPETMEIEGTTFTVTSIPESGFAYFYSARKFELPNTLTTIGNSAFYYCNLATEIAIPESVTSIGNKAFYSCPISEAIIPNGITRIGNGVFEFCENLSNVVIPNTVKSIGIMAFKNCKSLTEIELPESIENIADYTFSGCTNLLLVRCLATVPPTCNKSFNTTNEDLIIRVPAESLELYRSNASWNIYDIRAIGAEDEEEPEQPEEPEEPSEGVEEHAASFNIYPNPVNDKLYIETQTLTLTLTVKIYDVYGRQQSMVNGQQSTVIDVTDLNSGVYFVKVVTENGETVKRFIKK